MNQKINEKTIVIKNAHVLANAYLLFSESTKSLYEKTISILTNLLHISAPEQHTQENLMTLNKYPDIYFISAESTIKTENIIDIQKRIQYGPTHLPHMFIIIDQCHHLTKQAANKLLKTIEEPPQNVHFILLTTSKTKVLPTKRRILII